VSVGAAFLEGNAAGSVSVIARDSRPIWPLRCVRGVPWTGLVRSVAGTGLAHFVGLIRSLSASAVGSGVTRHRCATR
jgi:hypothetical protein